MAADMAADSDEHGHEHQWTGMNTGEHGDEHCPRPAKESADNLLKCHPTWFYEYEYQIVILQTAAP